jgi:hypothetical protein
LNVDAVAQADVHLKEIHIALDGAVKACTGLVGKTSAEILASVDASVVVTVSVFAQLLGSIVIVSHAWLILREGMSSSYI